MAENSKIEWCDSTFNPFIGCTKVSPGCDNCYAEKLMDHRMQKVVWGAGQARVRTSAANWCKPLAWNAAHEQFFAEHGRRQRVFCASLADVFDNAVDPQWRVDLFALIQKTPNLDWLLLTKRIGNVSGMVPLPWISKPFQHGPDLENIYPADWPANVWLGATICNQEEADRDIPKLLAVPARVRFLSIEPMLGPVELNGHDYPLAPGLTEGMDWLTGRRSQYSDIFGGDAFPWRERDDYKFPADACEPRLHWVIVGGESGPNARPMHPDWVRSIRDQCAGAGVAFLFKQWGEYIDMVDAHLDIEPGVYLNRDGRTANEAKAIADGGKWKGMYRVGKKAAGRLLDGVQHDGFPEVSHD